MLAPPRPPVPIPIYSGGCNRDNPRLSLSSLPMSPVNEDHRKALLFALTAERLKAWYDHDKWLTEAQGATLAGLWLGQAKVVLERRELRRLSDLSDGFARRIAASLSREAGLYTAHEMMEGLDPRYQSALVMQMMDECERLLMEEDDPASS